jgi:hypothetical protein
MSLLTEPRRHVAALVCVALPALLWLWPILGDLQHTILGSEGDNLYYVRHFWWVKHALVDLNRSIFFDPLSYYPVGYAISRGELTPINTVLGLPITLLAGPVAAYNAAVISSFLLTGFAAYAWAYRLSGSRAAAILAAVIAEMAPYRLVHSAGHLPLMSTDGFVLALWSFEEYLASRSRRWAIMLGVSLAVIALSSWYYAYSAALMMPIYAGLRMRSVPGLWRSREWWRGLALAVVIGGAVTVPFLVPYLRAALAGGLQKTSAEMMAWSLNFYDFVIPNVTHPWWTGVRALFPREASQWVERSVSLGYVALAFAAVAIVRRRRSGDGAIVWALVWVGLASALIALGPVLHWRDAPVLIPLPHAVSTALDWTFARVRPESGLRSSLQAQQALPVPLPTMLLLLLVPGTKGMRVMARFGYWTLLATAALAALGAKAILNGALGLSRNAAAALVGVAVAIVVFESWSSRTVSRWEPRAVDRFVASQPGREVVVELPLGEALRPAQDYYVTVQQHATVLGPIGDSFQPPSLFERVGVLSVPGAPALDALRQWGTTLVVLNPARETDAAAAWRAVLTGAKAVAIAEIDGVQVYRLRAPRGR